MNGLESEGRAEARSDGQLGARFGDEKKFGTGGRRGSGAHGRSEEHRALLALLVEPDGEARSIGSDHREQRNHRAEMERTIRPHPEGAFAVGRGDQFSLSDTKAFRIAQAGAPSRKKVPVERGQRLTAGLREGRGLTG